MLVTYIQVEPWPGLGRIGGDCGKGRMRWFFVVLLAFNLVYLGWELDRQIRINNANRTVAAIPDGISRLRLLSESNPMEVVAKRVDSQDVQVSDDDDYIALGGTTVLGNTGDELVSDLPDFRLSPSEQDPGQSVCFTFGPVPEETLATGLEDWFRSRRIPSQQRFTDEQGRRLFWVYLAPVSSRSGAMDTIEDFKAKGISDYRIITGGNLANAISLGLYSSQASVNDRINELQQKGYTPVVVPYSEGKRIYWVDVLFGKNPDDLDQLLGGFPSRYNYVPVDCAKIDVNVATP